MGKNKGIGDMAKQLRGDIQGLRAVAVLLVIAAHAGVPFLPGGFIGVDVFFVISGYLISSLLYREVSTSGRISLSSFWARRARRILPAATVVTVVSVVAALLWLSLVDARQVVVDALWAAIFAANVNFAQQGVYYFAQDTGPSPLQHYWSLAVEEQFYLAWPLLLLLCVGAATLIRGRRAEHQAQGHRLPHGVVLALLLLVTAASFAWSMHQTVAQPGAAYFSTFTRAWELGVGALVALIPDRRTMRLHRRTTSLLAATGCAAILLACIALTPDTPFPGWTAALPVLGAAALLVAGSGRTTSAPARLLGSRPLRTVGDWSFSLYLWHWPALILAPAVLGHTLSPGELLVLVAAVFALSALTYRYVEMPFRKGRPARTLRVRRALVLYPVSFALVATAAWGGWYWTGLQAGDGGDNPAITAMGGSDSTVALVRASVDAGRNGQAVPSDLNPDVLDLRNSIADVGACDYEQAVDLLCPRGDVEASRTVVVIGDSHARAWIPAFDKISLDGGWRAYYLVKPQCPAAHVTVAPLDEVQPFTECDDFHDFVIDQVQNLHPDLVVVASSPPVNGVFDGTRRVTSLAQVEPVLSAGYGELFQQLSAAAERVVLLRDVPKASDDPATCLTSGDANTGTCMFEPVTRSRELGDLAVDAARLDGVDVVDPTPWLCYQGECPVIIGGTLSYRDTDHLTTQYAESLAEPLGGALDMFSQLSD